MIMKISTKAKNHLKTAVRGCIVQIENIGHKVGPIQDKNYN